VAKLFSYGVVGALAGSLGGAVLAFLEASWLGLVIPWVLVGFFLAVATRLDRWLPKPAPLGNFYQASIRSVATRGRLLRAAFIGLASPLLPCGPLYIIFGLCLFSGSAARGAEFALGFGLGTLPLLWVAQVWLFRMQNGINTRHMERLRRVVALLAALVLIWRLRASLGLEGAVEWFCR
jgi:sulfite exporter TauE/SafE